MPLVLHVPASLPRGHAPKSPTVSTPCVVQHVPEMLKTIVQQATPPVFIPVAGGFDSAYVDVGDGQWASIVVVWCVRNVKMHHQGC